VSAHERPPAPEALTLLERGNVELQGRLPWSSNATFLVSVELDGTAIPAVYKPRRGERELWDFPSGLYQREVAAYVVSEALGWGVVPETLVRSDAPFGPGSVQRFVDADFAEHYFTLVEQPVHGPALRRIAVFDLLINNADRKSGHCLLGPDGRIWAIDHGLCFHGEPKLRTVMWEFAGEEIPEDLLGAVDGLADQPPAELGGLLDGDEVEALVARARRVVATGRFPAPNPSRRPYPWPLV
jgi:uncharacterized repeat protein (TIGR03843 family)